MDALSILLIVCAAVVHASWNLLAKKASGGALFVWWYSAVATLFYLPLIVWLWADAGIDWSVLGVLAIVASGLLHMGYAIALQAGYQRAELSIVYPVARGTGPALSVAGAVLLLGEPFTGALFLGACLVVGGVLVIGSGAAVAEGGLRRGIRWGVLTGAFIASYTVLDGAAVRLLAISPIVLDYFGNLIRVVALTPGAARNRAGATAQLKRNLLPILGCGVLAPISYVLVLFAMQRAPVSIVAPARELSMMVGVLFGWWFLREQNLRRRLFGAALIAAGVFLLTSG